MAKLFVGGDLAKSHEVRADFMIAAADSRGLVRMRGKLTTPATLVLEAGTEHLVELRDGRRGWVLLLDLLGDVAGEMTWEVNWQRDEA